MTFWEWLICRVRCFFTLLTAHGVTWSLGLPDWGIDEQTYRDVEDEICEANLPLPGCSQLKFCEKSFEDFAGLGYALDEEDHENRFVSVDCSKCTFSQFMHQFLTEPLYTFLHTFIGDVLTSSTNVHEP